MVLNGDVKRPKKREVTVVTRYLVTPVERSSAPDLDSASSATLGVTLETQALGGRQGARACEFFWEAGTGV